VNFPSVSRDTSIVEVIELIGELGTTIQQPIDPQGFFINSRGSGRKKLADELLTRKRKRNPEGWTKNVRKTSKMQGKSYITAKGKLVPAKTLKPPCSCKRKCFEKIDTDQMFVIGHHSNHPKTSDQDKNNIRNHIKMFPFKESHYSRNKTNKKYFLNPDLSISRMYDLYKNHCTENHFNILSEFMYRKIFVEEFNLAFKKPNIDTCQLCDKFETILKCSTVNEEIQDTIEEKNVPTFTNG